MTAPDRLTIALSGRYEIDREIGVGGMATVYLARDLRHQRMVALKLLSPELGAVLGPERFLSEIRVTANLQHPNLLPLFDSGEADGQLYYVMPYIDGESLRTRLERERQLPVREAVRIASAIASALDYAHRQGVIHRDLKPENILLHEGQPLVADFGIALAVSKAGGARVTQTGLSLGTPQYMSPEQASGERGIDARSDIYSLGAVLYEMLIGEPPHTGATVQAIIARVLAETPRSVRAARPSVPENVDFAVQKALQKVPADRFESAREFAEVLQGERPITLSNISAEPVPLARSRIGSGARLRDPVLIALALVTAILAAIAVAERARLRDTPERNVVRFAITTPGAERVSFTGPGLAISSDGKVIAYAAQPGQGSALYVRRMDEVGARVVPGTEGGTEPFFSPDGKWLGFLSESGVLKKVPIQGGAVVTLGSLVGMAGGAWGANRIIVGANDGLYTVSPAGGILERLTHGRQRGEGGYLLPLIAPDGEMVYFTISIDSTGPGVNQLASASLSDGKVRRIGIEGSNVIGFADGKLIYGRSDGTIWGAEFDYGKGRLLGKPVPLLENVSSFGGLGPMARLSAEGTFIYQQDSRTTNLVTVDQHGLASVLLGEPRDYRFPRFSPDGRQIALQIATEPRSDIWVYDLARRVLSRTTSSGDAFQPEWTPDGKRIGYLLGNDGAWWVAPDGSTPAERIFRFGFRGIAIREIVFGPDLSSAMIGTDSASGNRGLWALPLTGDRAARVFLQAPGWKLEPRISPDGKWVAYVSDESGALQVYVRALSTPSGRVQVSSYGGTQPVWSRNGRKLYYRTTEALMAATVDTRAGFSVVQQAKVFEDVYVQTPVSHAEYDVSPDDKSFIALRAVGDQSNLFVVLNWPQEVHARTATAELAK